MNCCCLRAPGQLLIGHTNELQIVGISGELKSYSISGKKKYVMMVKDSAVVGGFDENGQQVVTIYNLANEFIEYGVTLFRNGKTEYISFIINVWGMILIVTRTHTVFGLKEKDLQTKLNSLFEKHQYEIALSIAQSNQIDYNGLLDIHRMYVW